MWVAPRGPPPPRPVSGCCGPPPTCSAAAATTARAVADIAAAAGLSNSALYAYFGSRAELLVDALRAHGRRLLADLVAADPDPLDQRPPRSPTGRRCAGGGSPTATWSSRRSSRPAATRRWPRPMRGYIRRAGRLAGRPGRARPRAAASSTPRSSPTARRPLLPLAGRRDRAPEPGPARRRRRGVDGAARPRRRRPRTAPPPQNRWEAAMRVQIDSSAVPGPRPLLRPRPRPVRRGRGGLRDRDRAHRRRRRARRPGGRRPPRGGQLPRAAIDRPVLVEEA